MTTFHRAARLTAVLTTATLIAAVPAVWAPTAATAAPASISVGALTTNGRVDPLGIPGSPPVFGWQLASDERAESQSAYEIEVGTAASADDVWRSGRVESSAQVDVAYEGPALEAATEYHWRVRVWDGDGEASDWSDDASFETGLLTADDWGDADWIGRDAAYTDWTDYTTTVEFDLNAVAFGTFLRATSASNAYMWQINVGTTASAVPKLVPHRLVNGTYTLLSAVDLTAHGFTRAELLDGAHTISFAIEGDRISTTLDGTAIDSREVSDHPYGGVGVRTFGDESVDVRSIDVTAADGTELAHPDLADGNPFSAGTATSGGVLVSGGSDALLRTAESNAPLLRREFAVDADKTVSSARVYAAAHGIYELSLNGEKVGDQHLAPGYTEYDKRIQSQTYDVTDQLSAGANAFGAALGDGWWAGKIGLAGKGQYGSDLSLVARLKIEYTDGSTDWVDTGSDWAWATGPFAATDLQIGETYDARAERPGWGTAGYDDAGWAPVRIEESDTAKLSPQPDEPIRETEVLDTVEVTEPTDGTTVYDLGQNMVGVPRVTITGRAGQTAKIRHAEVLNPDGTIYTANLRAALATDYYTFAEDGTITYEPTFTQHGFRYIEISGLDEAPPAEDVRGAVWGSDISRTGRLETSNTMVDQLLSNVSWGARGNFLSIPTDTPARDERLGWTGDINVFAPTASYMFDMRGFLGKWMTDVRDEQKADGQIPAVVPSTKGAFDASGPGWQEAVVSVPYALFRAYGDLDVVRTNWAAMQKFYDFAASRIGEDNLGAHSSSFFTNDDWLSLEKTSGAANEAKSTALWADTARMMAEMAEALGDPRADEFADRAAQIKADFTAAYVASDGTVAGGTQTGYALALGMGLIDDPELRALAGERFVAKLAQTDNHLTTGFIGTPYLLPALSAIDRDDLAYEMLLKEDYPSWGYEIANGATTVWERWNSIQPDGSFGPVDMNSFNHYAYGAVADWMHQHIGGIRIDDPGYRSSIIEPTPGGGISEASGSIDTVYGELSSSWRMTDESFALDAAVPVGTTSTIRIPAPSLGAVTESGTPVGDAEGILDAEYDAAEGKAVITVGSGTYAFQAGSADPEIVVSAVTRCVAGAVQVVATVENTGDAELALTVSTAYGEKLIAALAPGKKRSIAFSSRADAVEAGEVAASWGDGAEATAGYAARDCG